ncbi:MAG: hypothetical protein RLZZ319_612, partial [Actinomycetota bacterium]
MKTLRIIFVWVLAVLFSGAITPTLMAWDEPAYAAGAGLQYQAFYFGSGAHPPTPTTANGINTSTYTKCAEGTVSDISTNWGSGAVMNAACGGDFVLVHWYGYIKNPTTQTMYFRSYADDGSWLAINDTQIINDWSDKGCGYRNTGSFNFTANTWYKIDYWFYEWGGGACAQLYSSTSSNGSYSLVSSSNFDQAGTTPVTFTGAGTDTSVASTAQRGGAYSDSVTALGSGSITYAVKTGSLPPGISLNSGGTLSGSPTTNGTYTFTVEATGVDGSATTTATTGSLSIQVGDAPTMTNTSVNDALVLNQSITPIDVSDDSADPAATYSVSSGNLPAGLTLNSSTGVISGTPTTKQVKTFTITASNAIGSSTTPNLSLTVGVAPDISGSTMEQAVTINNAMTTTWFADNNAYPAPTYSISDGTLPSGVSLNSNNGSLSGTPTERGVFLFTITATNSLGSST